MQTQYLILKVYMGQELELQQAIRKTVKTSSIGVRSLPKNNSTVSHKLKYYLFLTVLPEYGF